MSNSPILKIPEISSNQNNKHLTHNNAINYLEQAANAGYINSASGTSDIDVSEDDAVRYFLYDFQGASGDRTITFPATIATQDRVRFFCVKNSTAYTLTLEAAGTPGDAISLIAGSGVYVYQLNDDLYALGFFELVGTGKSYDVGLFIPGKPDPTTVITQFTSARTFTLADEFAGSVGSVTTPPSSTMTLDVLKNASKIGEVAIDNAGVFTFTTTAGSVETFNAGDKLIVKSQASVPTGVFDISITFRGSR